MTPALLTSRSSGPVEPLGQRVHRLLGGEVEPLDPDGARHAGGADPLGGRLTGIRVAHRQHDVGAVPGELERLDEADAGVGAGDQRRGAGQVADPVGGPAHGGSSGGGAVRWRGDWPCPVSRLALDANGGASRAGRPPVVLLCSGPSAGGSRRQEPGVDVSEPGAASRSARLRRMQNSLPSGSARMTQPVPGPYCPRWSATSTAPCSSSRASSSSRRALDRLEVEVDAVLARLGLGHLDEQQPVRAVAAEDHALLVAREVRVALDVDVVEHPLPPLGERVRVAAVDGRVGHPCGHRATLPLRWPRAPSEHSIRRSGRGRSDDDRGADAVREHLGRVRQQPRVTRRATVRRPRHRAGVEHVVRRRTRCP